MTERHDPSAEVEVLRDVDLSSKVEDLLRDIRKGIREAEPEDGISKIVRELKTTSSRTVSDCHGYTQPAGFGPGFFRGPGPGTTFCTPAKPVPQRRVGGFWWGTESATRCESSVVFYVNFKLLIIKIG